MGFGKRVVSYNYHYYIIQNCLTSPPPPTKKEKRKTKPCALPIEPPPQAPGNHGSVYHPHVVWSRISCKWIHTPFQTGFFPQQQAFNTDPCLFVFLIIFFNSSFLGIVEKSSILQMCHNVFIHSPTEGHPVCFQFSQLRIQLSLTLLCSFEGQLSITLLCSFEGS